MIEGSKVCTQCKEILPYSKFGRKKANRKTGRRPECNACRKLWRLQNKELIKRTSKAYYDKNRDTLIAKNITYAKGNPKVIANGARRYRENSTQRRLEAKIYRENNSERIKLEKRAYVIKNRVRDRPKVLAYAVKYKCDRAHRTPHWLTSDDFRFMELFYKEASRLTKGTGIPHHVDHIVPLRGKYVSGLHCPDNLQILTAAENLSKSNKFDLENQ